MKLGITGRIAQASARRPGLTIASWLALLITAGFFASTIDTYVTAEQTNLVATEADAAADLDEQLRKSRTGTAVFEESVIVTSDTLHYGDPEFNNAVAAAMAELSGIEGVSNIKSPSEGGSIAPNGQSAIITFATAADTDVVKRAMDGIGTLEHRDVEMFVFGEESTLLAFGELASEELARSEGFGLIAALVILVVVFGALVSAGLPLIVALSSIVAATGLGAIVSRILGAYDVPMGDSITVFIAMLGLALGIDYSLLTVQRFREELALGRTVMDAISITGNTANRAVLISGATIVVALGGLLIIPINMFLGIGVGVMVVAFTSVGSALFLLPALLRLLGHRVNKGRVPTAHPGLESPRWRRLATRVVSRPALAAVLGVVLLLAAAAPVLGVRFMNPGPESLPEDFVAHRANNVMVQDFGWADTATLISIENAASAPDAVDRLADAVEQDPAFAGTALEWVGNAAFIDTHDVWDASNPESERAIDRLRDTLIPAALDGTGASASVGGSRAYVMDEVELITSRAPIAVIFILAVTFVLLLVMFRSVVIPLKAIAVNLLGAGATFGALVAMYQWGWGAALLGLPQLEGISPYMPVMIFALVFGLSMDYHVFLLSRIKERHDATGDNREAVIDGVARTGPLITGAALIMVAVFSGFAAAGIPELSQWGFGLAFGVLLDATIIRVLLVPATMVWLGRANWYLPSWLEWLPHFAIEPAEAPAPRAREEAREPALA